MTWNAGDLAVCVDATWPAAHVDPMLVKGRIYRVTAVHMETDSCGEIGLSIEGLNPLAFYDGVTDWLPAFSASRFRKLLPAEPCFAEAMRSLKPKVSA